MKRTEILQLIGEKNIGGAEADRKEDGLPEQESRKGELSMEELESVSGGI